MGRYKARQESPLKQYDALQKITKILDKGIENLSKKESSELDVIIQWWGTLYIREVEKRNSQKKRKLEELLCQ